MTPPLPPADPSTARLIAAVTLDGLRGFEAAARLQSFTAAAEALCLTQSAVSKQVKALEDTLGRPLFVRGSRALQLTEAGQALYLGVQAMLAQLARTLAAITPPARTMVSLTMPPAFASLWLTPRLAAFRDEAPGTDLRIDASEDALLLDRQGFDLAIRLASSQGGRGPDDSAPWVLAETLQLVAAPALARRIAQPRDLLDAAWLSFDHPARRHPGLDWPHWQAALSLPGGAAHGLHRFSQYEPLLKAACDGLGVAIGRRPLIDHLLAQGRLALVLPAHSLPGPRYHLVWAAGAQDKPAVRQFAAWLHGQLGRPAAGARAEAA